ncbi:hypothetical protein FZ103_08860 [Streptomonospora sp. PA3]|uniref:hypothetical protein n=1 Tax=Streptomonospora sp. PA3 TaxID=2607326 RepID=UPI0012DF3EFC|nr:hypothetical protein [Streptomonospora sp. PA3]MUL41286.1 hypothetical protein [Streptomonospora sp. PA3]
MAEQEPSSPLKDKNYNLVWVVQQSLENVFRLETYIQDAEKQGDDEVAGWLRKIQENNKKAGEQGKRMLAQRLQAEGG